ncbi:glucuronate isomerase [Peribacillus sp. NPDC096540]
MPIIDFNCHLSPQEVWKNKPYENNITQLWLDGKLKAIEETRQK